MAGAKASTLLNNGENIQEFIDNHLTFKAANKLARSIKIKEGLPKSLNPRIINVTNPQEIIELLISLNLADDVLIPLARKETKVLTPNSFLSRITCISNYFWIHSKIRQNVYNKKIELYYYSYGNFNIR